MNDVFDIKPYLSNHSGTVLVAEISANHNGDIEGAKNLIRLAKESGADAVKFQTYKASSLTIDSRKSPFLIDSGPWSGRTLYELYTEASTPYEWFEELKETADEEGIFFFSTPFDIEATELLIKLKVPCLKVASFEITDVGFLREIARHQLPMVVSTGLSSLSEIAEAVAAIRSQNNKKIVLLKCTSAYPARFEEMNLLGMRSLSREFDVQVGLSDHSLDNRAALAAVAMGASLIEKHFTDNRQKGGPDSHFSLEPAEFSNLVTEVRSLEKALGNGRLNPTGEEQNYKKFRRSIFVVSDIEEGEEITPTNVRVIRPGDGMAPKYLTEVLGKKVVRRLERGTPLLAEHVVGLSSSDET